MMMDKQAQEFLTQLLETPSPSGFEEPLQRVVKRYVNRFADSVDVDIHGNCIAVFNPQGKVKVMLAGHCDQIGMMVTHIDDHGYISFSAIGGLDPSVIPGSRVSIHSREGVVEGVIGNKPVHLLSGEERGKRIELKKLWIDIGAESGREARLQVSIGDPVTYALGVQKLGKTVITSPGCDDRVGVFVVMEALRWVSKLVKKKKQFPVALYAASTVQEEIGLRGAKTASYRIDPLVGIAVDVTHASDNPGCEAREIGTVKLGLGPTIARGANINPILEALLVSTAKKKKIAYQPLGVSNASGTDANVMQVNRQGVATALIGIPNRYMHTQVELVDTRDLEAAAKLIAYTILEITPRKSFIPG